MNKRVAFCWELGAGLGHFSTLDPLVRFFIAQGFEVSFIARDVWSAGRWFKNADVTLFQAPFRHGAGLQFSATPTFAHILHNVGFGDPDGLFSLAGSWKSLLELIRPNLVIADHSPTAILAARGLGVPMVICGPGFGYPPDESPLPDLLPRLNTDPMQLVATETQVLDGINSVLDRWNRPGLERVTQLYHDGPKGMLLTFEELDHFPTRTGARYWGYWPFQPGPPIEWPAGSGPRIFAYLNRTPHLPALLQMLGRKPFRTVAYVGTDSQDLQRQFQTPTLQIRDRMVDLQDAGQHSDLAITHGNLGTTTAMLLSGVPVLCLPNHLEQLLIGKAVERLGAGGIAPPESLPLCEKALDALSSQSKYRESATAFANRYREFTLDRHREQIEAELARPFQPL